MTGFNPFTFAAGLAVGYVFWPFVDKLRDKILESRVKRSRKKPEPRVTWMYPAYDDSFPEYLDEDDYPY